MRLPSPENVPFPTYFKFSPGEVVNEPLTPPLSQVTGEVDYLSFITPLALTPLSPHRGLPLLRHVTSQHGAPQS